MKNAKLLVEGRLQKQRTKHHELVNFVTAVGSKNAKRPIFKPYVKRSTGTKNRGGGGGVRF